MRPSPKSIARYMPIIRSADLSDAQNVPVFVPVSGSKVLLCVPERYQERLAPGLATPWGDCASYCSDSHFPKVARTNCKTVIPWVQIPVPPPTLTTRPMRTCLPARERGHRVLPRRLCRFWSRFFLPLVVSRLADHEVIGDLAVLLRNPDSSGQTERTRFLVSSRTVPRNRHSPRLLGFALADEQHAVRHVADLGSCHVTPAQACRRQEA